MNNKVRNLKDENNMLKSEVSEAAKFLIKHSKIVQDTISSNKLLLSNLEDI